MQLPLAINTPTDGGPMKAFLILAYSFCFLATAQAEVQLPLDFLTTNEELLTISCTDAYQEIYVGYKMINVKDNYEGRSVVSIKHRQWNPGLRLMLGGVETMHFVVDVNVTAPKATVLKMNVPRCNGDENLKMGKYILYYDATIVRKDGKPLIDVWNDGQDHQDHKIIEAGLLCNAIVTGCQE